MDTKSRRLSPWVAWFRGFPVSVVWIVAAFASWSVRADEFRIRPAKPTMDRWMYPFNFQPGVRPVAPTYGSFDPRFDTRDAQMLLGWDTAAVVPASAGASKYLIRSVRVTLTSVAPIPPTRPFVYDPTHDGFQTYMTNIDGAVPDSDPGRPIEIFGVGFRGGFTTEAFHEDSAFGPLGPIAGGNISIGTRNAYAAVFDTNGVLVDVANHVGQRNSAWTNAPFEIRPWGIGTTTNAAPGEEMPDGGRMTFELDLQDPLVAGYVQRGLNEGRIRLMVSSLSPAGQSTPGGTGPGGGGAYPWWATKENLLYDPPSVEIEGTLIGEVDSDSDGLPDDWERFWIGDLSGNAGDDSDGDGSSNAREYQAGTDPGLRSSCLRIASSDLTASPIRIRFTIAPSRAYRIERSIDLATWEPQEGTMSYPEAGMAEWRSSASSEPSGGAFYRVRLEP